MSVKYLTDHQKNLFFVFNGGRCGSQLLSNLLNQSEFANVYHEPNFEDDVKLLDFHRRNPEQALRYWKEFRSKEICKRWNLSESLYYGEVNGTIRYQAEAIKTLFPNANFYLLSSDPKKAIRTVMGWPQFYGPKSEGAYALEPIGEDTYIDKWDEMDRFEKLCWGWQNCYNELIQLVPKENWFKLSQITESFDFFNNTFNERFGLKISYDIWSETISKKSANSTNKHSFPSFSKWTSSQKKSFMNICGETMEKLNYT